MMLNRLYVNNFKCLVNFEMSLAKNHSALLIGRNGSGKSSVANVLEFFQRIGRGENRLEKLVKEEDFCLFMQPKTPMRLELEVCIDDKIYSYALEIEYPSGFHAARVVSEKMSVDGTPRFERHKAQTKVTSRSTEFFVDWHMIALPIIQDTGNKDSLVVFRNWLKQMMILRPIPSQMNCEAKSDDESLIEDNGRNIASWLSDMLSNHPAAYSDMSEQLKQIFPDFHSFIFQSTGKNAKELIVRFDRESDSIQLPMNLLSDGEKCLLLSSIVCSAAKQYNVPFCFWDEPGNYVSLEELDNFVRSLRRIFEKKNGQLIVVSHSEQAIKGFADENTWLFERKSHLEPTLPLQSVEDLRNSGRFSGELIQALNSGDIYAS
ncbi:MAG: AAA family ATPase [Victivallales bacterium]|jgi:predicted ATPase|nr:AAA family ATPase [Victivallales bacterium]